MNWIVPLKWRPPQRNRFKRCCHASGGNELNDTSTFPAQEENWKRNGFTVAQAVTKKTDACRRSRKSISEMCFIFTDQMGEMSRNGDK